MASCNEVYWPEPSAATMVSAFAKATARLASGLGAAARLENRIERRNQPAATAQLDLEAGLVVPRECRAAKTMPRGTDSPASKIRGDLMVICASRANVGSPFTSRAGRPLA